MTPELEKAFEDLTGQVEEATWKTVVEAEHLGKALKTIEYILVRQQRLLDKLNQTSN